MNDSTYILKFLGISLKTEPSLSVIRKNTRAYQNQIINITVLYFLFSLSLTTVEYFTKYLHLQMFLLQFQQSVFTSLK